MSILLRIIPFLCCALLLGCASSGSESPQRTQQPKSQKNAPLDVFEREFSPSQFDVAIAEVESSTQRYTTKDRDTINATANSAVELVAGFRVQVIFSNSIDEATKIKNEVISLFPTDMVYMLYDSPYYKVRVGDYRERNTAARTLKILMDKGYVQSWIVPDRIQKNPTKPPPLPQK
jgi:hypothetical protein